MEVLRETRPTPDFVIQLCQNEHGYFASIHYDPEQGSGSLVPIFHEPIKVVFPEETETEDFMEHALNAIMDILNQMYAPYLEYYLTQAWINEGTKAAEKGGKRGIQ